MRTYIALFRGINVGGKNKLPMKDLSQILEQQGYLQVRTYIQSGNVVFNSSQALTSTTTKTISQAIGKTFGFEPEILILQAQQLQQAIADNPFPTDKGNALHFFFLEAAPTHLDLEALTGRKAPSESFHLGKQVFYLHAPDGIGRSKLAASAERLLGVPATARNGNTVFKLAAMIGDSP